MTLTPNQRRTGLGCALVLTIAVTVVFGNDRPAPLETQETTPEARSPRKSATEEIAGKPAGIAIEKLARTPPSTDGIDLFAAKSWHAPPVAAAKSPPPPKPAAPPLPFDYVGQIEGKEGLIVFLAEGDDLISAKAGEQLGQNYRLEKVSAEQLTFVYLPLDERQTLTAEAK